MTDTDQKSNKVVELKERITDELGEIDKDIKDMEKSKKDSVERLEIKKVELKKKYSGTEAVCEEHYATLQEIEQTSKLIEERKTSITALDTTIANLDMQISEIQSEHDKAVAELEKKRRRLNDYLKYYEDLNDKLEKLIELLGEEEKKHCIELNHLKVKRAKTLARTDLSEDAINKELKELDDKMVVLNTEHGKLIDSISQKLSEITVDASGVEELLSKDKKATPVGDETSEATATATATTIDDAGAVPDGDDIKITGDKSADGKGAGGKGAGGKGAGGKGAGGKGAGGKGSDDGADDDADGDDDAAGGGGKGAGGKGARGKGAGGKGAGAAGEELDASKKDKAEGDDADGKKTKEKKSAMDTAKTKEEKEAAALKAKEEAAIKKKGEKRGVGESADSDGLTLDEDAADAKEKKKGKKSKKKKRGKKGAAEGEGEAEDYDLDEEEGDDESLDEELIDWYALEDQNMRIDLLKRGVQITPSNRIITADDKVVSLKEAQRLGLLSGVFDVEEEEVAETAAAGDVLGISEFKKKKSRDQVMEFYKSPPSSASSVGKESSESRICGRDVEYLKVVFGKALTIALAEITAKQPTDPVHYLAHWMLRYRYNQEIDQVTRIQVQELMIEQERLAAEKWHRELQEEARLAVLEALFRAENIIIQRDFQSELQLHEYEGEFEESSPTPAKV